MAEDFAEWLRLAINKHATHVDKRILIVSVTGKSDTGTNKYALVDQLLENTVFCGRYKEESLINIDAYYSEYHQIVFLYLNSYQDADLQERLFDSEKSFFEVLNEVEHLYIEHLFILSVLSHLIVFLHPDTRGDTTILRHLISVNEMRNQRRAQLMKLLDQLEDFPSTWQEEGRLALPRLLFIFRDNRARSNYAKTSAEDLENSIDRLERTREFQLVHMLKRCQIAAEHLGIALASLTPHRVPFVHVLLPGDSEVNAVNETISLMFRGDIPLTDIRSQLEQQTTSVLPLDSRLDSSQFLLGHVKDIIKNENNLPYFFLLPKLKDFVLGAQIVAKAATTDEIYSQELIKSWLSEELHFINDAMSQLTFYAYELYNHLIIDDRIGPMFYDPNLNEFRHIRALQYVGAFLKMTLNGSQLKIAWPKLLKQCNSRFKARRAQCTARSLSGARCTLLVHKLPAEYDPQSEQTMEEALKGRSFIHCSGYSYLSTCSCGKSQKRRLDPFTAKEANYDFYSTFACCTKTEIMSFQLYNPGIQWNVSQTKSVVVKRRDRGRRDKDSKLPRGAQLLARGQENSAGSEPDQRYGTYTVVKPKSQTRIVNELLWQYNKMVHEHKGNYLEHMPHSSTTTTLPPLYPSWSVLCVGHSKLYVHAKGLTDQPGFLRGADYLMPYDLNMTVKSEAWAKGMKEILRVDRLPWNERRNDKNPIDKTHKEKLKFFVGFEYECAEGHRFMIEKANKIMSHDKMNGNMAIDAAELLESELPLLMSCKCSTDENPVYAQLMRLHIVSPKAPISTKINPLIKFDETGYFHLGTTAEINYGRYYILRFPFVYEGPSGVMERKSNAVLLGNSIQIYQKM